MKHPLLDRFLKKYQNNNSIKTLRDSLTDLTSSDTKKLIEIYTQAIPCIEDCLWENHISASDLSAYQSLFREYEENISASVSGDSRFNFIITIPVADRPQHLKNCLHSILAICEKYQYGGATNHTYHKIFVLISDDSQHTKNIDKNIALTQKFNELGLQCIYFGAQQQKALLSTLDQKKLKNITGNIDADNFFHKGASITRNISYLKLQQLQSQHHPCLFYFIDSDQEFKINIATVDGSKNQYAINYFYHLDKIFSNNDISMLTGKVVGDPPVSPAVMVGTFLDDIIHFLGKIYRLKPQKNCQFHDNTSISSEDAAYHDMAELFGFKTSAVSYNYRCTLTKPHNHTDCLNHFSTTLNQFFDGEHPTRKSYYKHQPIDKSIKPARTIYTGNYIFKPENLKYFIPFANLKLRMAGPVLGRIIQSELGNKFVSANLPMLHNRTVESMGQSEYRSGVDHHHSNIDLSGEFIRQFFGDVMLFSIVELKQSPAFEKDISVSAIQSIVNATFLSMKTKYIDKQKIIFKKALALKKLFNHTDCWWNNQQESVPAITDFKNFMHNIEYNFGENATVYTLISTPDQTEPYLQQIIQAICSYQTDRENWQYILSENNGISI